MIIKMNKLLNQFRIRDLCRIDLAKKFSTQLNIEPNLKTEQPI